MANVETLQNLGQFTGTENWYRHALNRKVLYTDGVQYVAENAGAYWLVDEVALAQAVRSVAAQPFQVWKLDVEQNSDAALLTCEDGNGNGLFKKQINYTNFPKQGITFYVCDSTILLPSEY